MRKTRWDGKPPDKKQLKRRHANEERTLLFSDVSGCPIETQRLGKVPHGARMTTAESLEWGAAGGAFTWWSKMTALERAALFARVAEQHDPASTARDLKAKQKKAPDRKAGGAT